MDLQTRFVCVYSRAIQSGSIFDGAEKKERATREANATRTARTNHTTVVRRFMTTLAIRQGDVLFFARSLVWRQTIMSIEENKILEMPEGERYTRFCIAVQEHRKAGFEFSQEQVDVIAALFKVKAPRLPTVQRQSHPAIPNIPFDQRPIG